MRSSLNRVVLAAWKRVSLLSVRRGSTWKPRAVSAIVRARAATPPPAPLVRCHTMAKFSSASQITPDIDFSKLDFKECSEPKKMPVWDEKLEFGCNFSDHLLEIDWKKGEGWSNPKIRPYGPFSLDPAANVLHYAMEAFEGLKAYVDSKGNVRMFRPDMNVKRMQSSCRALAFPTFNGPEFEKCIKELVRIDRRWIPDKPGFSLYIRPTVISTDPRVKVFPSERVKLYVILSPVGPYYTNGFAPVSLYADDKHARAWKGGVGCYKLGSNYGPTIYPQLEAIKKGFDQILWLYGDERYVTEVGTMNQFFHWINEDGEKELITAPLSQGVILPGVTRDSILHLARTSMTESVGKVSERTYTMYDVAKACKEGRMLESFGAGTAAIVSPVHMIHFEGENYNIPCGDDGKIGPLAKKFADTLMGIQYGQIEHEWSVVVCDNEGNKV